MKRCRHYVGAIIVKETYIEFLFKILKGITKLFPKVALRRFFWHARMRAFF